ncbi:MAG TPA: hypothetical protein VN764_18490 [Polyangiaceae bacterium]|nr:hypothetical protein [Polyangiaceae bacterium]
MIGIPIHLDDELELRAQEVDDELPNDLLPPKGDTESPATNGGPHELL